MEGKKTRPYALLVFGAPCSGKTTFCEKFAEKYNLAYFDLEKLSLENNLSKKMLMLIIEQLLKTGQNLIFEGKIETEKERRELTNLLYRYNYQPSLIWIQTDISTIRSRLKARHQNIRDAKNIYDTKLASLEAPSELEHPIILSGKHTFETQAKHTLTGLSR